MGLSASRSTKALGCVAAASPATRLPVNQANVALPEGTKVRWQDKANGLKGCFALNAGLGVGEGFAATGAIDASAAAGTGCSAKLLRGKAVLAGRRRPMPLIRKTR